MKQEIVVSVNDEGKVEGGRKSIAKAFLLYAGKRVRVTIERYVSKRTLPQNAYLHVVIREVQLALLNLGWDQANDYYWVKDLCKYKFLRYEAVNPKTGEVIEGIRATSSLSKEEVSELIEQIKIWAADELGHYIADADEQVKMFD